MQRERGRLRSPVTGEVVGSSDGLGVPQKSGAANMIRYVVIRKIPVM